jgi:MBG domain (YGX type)
MTINNGTLTVTPAPLSIVADDVTRAAGTPNPTFTGTSSGLKNGDAITANPGQPGNGRQ